MLTGFWIEDGRIYGPGGDTRSWVKNGHIFVEGEEFPKYWIRDGAVIATLEGDTEFTVENGYIYGPSEELPWLKH